MPDLRRRPPRRTPESHPEDEAYQRWVGERIRALRAATGLNQEDFSYLVGVQRSYMGLIENGKRDLRVNTLRRIAQSCGLQVQELLDPGFALTAERISNELDV